MTDITVYIQENGMAMLVCPKCGHVHKLKAEKFKDKSRERFLAKCQCSEVLRIRLEFRGHVRKEVLLSGTYSVIEADGAVGGRVPIEVYNISGTGVGFVALGQEPQVGQKIRLNFELDNRKQSKIEKDAFVRSKQGNIIGCEFSNPGEITGDLGFYLRN